MQKHQLGISYPIGDWVFVFWLSCPVLNIPNPQGSADLAGLCANTDANHTNTTF